MKTLFMIIHSPFERKEVDTLLSIIKSGDGIIFTKNGVFINNYKEFDTTKLEGVKIYGLKEDLDARGIKDWKYAAVDYDGFADLIIEYGKVIS